LVAEFLDQPIEALIVKRVVDQHRQRRSMLEALLVPVEHRLLPHDRAPLRRSYLHSTNWCRGYVGQGQGGQHISS
jgi:hypothetical protein